MNLPPVHFFQSSKLIPESLVFHKYVLVLVKKIVDPELHFRKSYFLSAELVFELNEFVLELDSEFSFVVEITLKLLFGLSEFLSLVFKHVFDLSEIVVFVESLV